MSTQAEAEILQEYSDCRGQQLRVDRAAGVIHGVKLLGTSSKKGRDYPPDVIARAAPMYEGLRVNIDHVAPGQRRSLRDRIGAVKHVALGEDGLYGDFHYNPKHPLAEQIAWDAENAPQNLGFSHDSRGATRKIGDRDVVQSIDRVLSVDLVANPATTNGLFEDISLQEEVDALKAEKAALLVELDALKAQKATFQEGLDPHASPHASPLRGVPHTGAAWSQEAAGAPLPDRVRKWRS